MLVDGEGIVIPFVLFFGKPLIKSVPTRYSEDLLQCCDAVGI
jgi:hypothetical protein